MNIKNALCFFILGLLMHTSPAIAQMVSSDVVMSESSVRAVWLEFMSWVVGTVGISYLTHEGVVRLHSFLLAVIPAKLLRPSEAPLEQMRFRTNVRVATTY
ncbi:MAG: hypothetical protein QM715_02235 [Nibricoccus sp.]